jgi:hypothetical protein
MAAQLVRATTSPYVRGMERRDFVRASLSLAGATLVAGGGAACGGSAFPPGGVDLPALLTAMGRERIVRIGRAYLASFPTEGTPERLRAAIQKDLAPWPWSSTMRVSDRVTDDFTQMRTVLADGWMLSVTEARQCALYTLLNG